MLPECGSDIQMCSRISGVKLWKLDSETDAGYVKKLHGSRLFTANMVKRPALPGFTDHPVYGII